MNKKMLGILAAILGGGVSDQLGWTGGESGQTKPQRRQSAAQALPSPISLSPQIGRAHV